MATIIMNAKKTSADDGESIIDACKEVGVPFGCHSGICGTCMIDVLEGDDNLTRPTHAEQSMKITPPRRLACQCRITGGTITIKLAR